MKEELINKIEMSCSLVAFEALLSHYKNRKKLHQKFEFPLHKFNCREIDVSMELNCMDQILIIGKPYLRNMQSHDA